MAKSEFPEVQFFGYHNSSLLDYLESRNIRAGNLVAPSQQDEADLGYDLRAKSLKWGTLYLQYKVPEIMTRRNASEWNFFNTPYYRFRVKTDKTKNGNIQHNTLVELEESLQDPSFKNQPPGVVRYVSPTFHTYTDLQNSFIQKTILARSVYASPRTLGIVEENSDHKYAYLGNNFIRAFSDPTPPTEGTFESTIDKFIDSLAASEPKVGEIYLSQLDSLLDQVNTKLRIAHRIEERSNFPQDHTGIIQHNSTSPSELENNDQGTERNLFPDGIEPPPPEPGHSLETGRDITNWRESLVRNFTSLGIMPITVRMKP